MRRGVRALAAVLVAGCAARGAPAPVTPEVFRLAAELDSAFAGPEFARAQWGVVVQSLDNGEVMYRRNAEKLFMPASNMKLVTGAAALVRLGADYRYRTAVLARGPRSGDTLAGDLVVVGRGDPSLSQHAAGAADVLATLRPWAESLRARGVLVVRGRVVGDASWFPDPTLGAGWMWDDLPDSYSAPVGALQFNEGFAVIEIAPAAVAGQPAPVTLAPRDAPLRVFSSVVTALPDSAANRITWTRAPFTDSVPLAGRITVGQAPVRLEIAVPDPTRYFEAALTQALREGGVTVLGERPPAPPASPSPADTLFVWQSIPLRDILPLLMKPSQNQIAEALLRTVGGEATGTASVDSGRSVARDVLRGFGVPDDAYLMADGSGLSRYNYLAPELIARVLVGMARRPDFQVWYDALPIAAVDGTIAGRMRGTAAAGNVRAKTGSIANTRSLSGYVTTADGERLVFVLMANHFTVSRRVVELVQDHVAERLANFRRLTRTR